MREGPVLFKGEMVRAILEDRKTMTRRVIDPQPKRVYGTVGFNEYTYVQTEQLFRDNRHGVKCPFGQPGDRLWVRENLLFGVDYDHLSPSEIPTTAIPVYLADNLPFEYWHGKTRPSIFMPRWASRITLLIADIRVERLRDISAEDAEKEGVELVDHNCYRNYLANQDWEFNGRNQRGYHALQDPVMSFASLWDSINGKRPGCSWTDNPFVWCISFKRVEGD